MLYDYECPQCGQIVRDVTTDRNNPFFEQTCLPCAEKHERVVLRRLPSAPNFTIKGFSAKNGYSK